MALRMLRKRITKKVVMGISVALLAFQPIGLLLATKNVSALSTVHTSGMSTWDLSETRAKGHNELVQGGLRVWTDDNDSLSKAAGYYATPGLKLSDVNSTSISLKSFTGGRPSVQLSVDRDGNGTFDGNLVYEPWAYGDGQYWTNQSGFGVASGGGYPSMGTLAQYQAANPNANILAIGYSLGSGVKGDAIITNITIGSTIYTFGALDTTKPTITINTNTNINNGSFGVDGHYSRISFKLFDKDSNLKEAAINGNVYARGGMWNDLNWQNINRAHLVQGTNTVVVRDKAGNESSLTFVYDSVGPKVTIKDDSTAGYDGTVYSKISFKLFDSAKVDKYSINGTEVDLDNNTWSDANFQNIKSRLVQGENTFVAYDVLGNMTSYSFSYDGTIPEVTVDAQAEYTDDKPVEIGFSARDDSVGVKRIDVEITGVTSDGQRIGRSCTSNPAKLKTEITSSCVKDLPAGEYHVVVKATDGAGNVAITEADFRVAAAVVVDPGTGEGENPGGGETGENPGNGDNNSGQTDGNTTNPTDSESTTATPAGGAAPLSVVALVGRTGNSLESAILNNNTDAGEVLSAENNAQNQSSVLNSADNLAAINSSQKKDGDFQSSLLQWWWVLLVVIGAGILWWLIAAARRRRDDEEN